MATTLLTSGITMGSSTLNVSGTAPSYSVRAWVNFNGTGTVAIRGNGNVTSITDGGTGNYTVNYTTAIADATYAALFSVGFPGQNGAEGPHIDSDVYSTSGVRLSIRNATNNAVDREFILVCIIR